MTVTDQVSAPADNLSVRLTRPARPLRRPSLAWTLRGAAPVHDFPIRDEILFQFTPPISDGEYLEIGAGSGYTAYCLARQTDHLTIADYAEVTLADLRGKLGTIRNISFAQADLSKPNLDHSLGNSFDFIYGLDMFEYVPDAQCGLTNIASLLRPGGVMFMTFPNQLPPKGDGVTWYSTLDELETQLRAAGFSRWDIFTVNQSAYASAVYAVMHEWPLFLYRWLRGSDSKVDLPQTYEETWAFKNRGKLQTIKPLIHSYWALLSIVLKVGGRVFRASTATQDLLGHQLVIRAWK
jgi:2-polyprenyl-3-methyl-5-hydroxy-6-metoxy-1,4-benzoquinol methylase